LGKRIKEVRESKGIKQTALAEMSGISRRTIVRIEKEGCCQVDTLVILAQALRVSPGSLIPQTIPL
jgi:transcriptional regulator with XRE-family HTH domain